MTQRLPADDLRPDTPFWAVGDVHGRLDLLEPLLAQLRGDGLPIVLLGDYVNKGPQSAGVLTALRAIPADARVVALRGNHEDLFLRFLKRPWRTGRTLLRYGGMATFQSFGVPQFDPTAEKPDFGLARDHILAAMPGLVDWLSRLPYIWQSGNVAALHAGADPDVDLVAQPQKGFAWGHANFDRRARHDGTWIVHGHRPVSQVTITDRRIAIDTQAYETGRLTAVRISTGAAEVL